MLQEQYELILNQMGEIAYTVDNTYLLDLQSGSYQILPFGEYRKSFSYQKNIRALQIKKWVFDKEQNIGDCFKNVLSLFAFGNDTIALVVKRKLLSTEMYFIIQNPDSSSGGTMRSKIELLENSLKGNFPGTKTEVMCDISGVHKTEELFQYDEAIRSVAVMVNSPSKYSEEYLTQGIDKLLNGIVPKTESEEYTVIFLAESLSYETIAEIISGYEDLANAVFPYTTYQEQHGKNHTDSLSFSKSDANSEGTSKAINRTHSVNAHIGFMGLGGGYGYSWGTSNSNFSSNTRTDTETKGTTDGTSDTITHNFENLKKGNFGEMRTDQYLREKGYRRLNIDSVTSMKDTGHHGLDGVYDNPNGKPKFLIVDAKFGSAKLDKKTGQMSWNWIDKHLDAAVGKEKAEEIRQARKENPDGVCCCVSHVDKKGNVILKPVNVE